jgi:predicted heme/steroid binding protein
MKTMTEEELRKHEGSNGSAYVACAGKVYDVSRSYHWRRGVTTSGMVLVVTLLMP